MFSFPLIAPSLLAADFGRLADDIRAAEDAGAEVFHLDIMDGHFVPNLSFGIPVVEAIRRATVLPLDVHLMLSEPERYLAAFRNAGADWLTIHIEVQSDPRRLLDEIRKLGCRAGLSLNPPTPVETVLPFVSDSDLILVMSVMPGFGGQSFDPVALEKIAAIRDAALKEPTRTPKDFMISVDGGVSLATIRDCAKAGAQLFVVGTGFFAADDYKIRLKELTELARMTK